MFLFLINFLIYNINSSSHLAFVHFFHTLRHFGTTVFKPAYPLLPKKPTINAQT